MRRTLLKAGVAAEDAEIASDVLLAADARGIESHGIIRLYSHYVNRIRRGLINLHPQPCTLRETQASLALDADNGLGHPVAYRAMQRCMQKAQAAGVGVVSVRNSNHYGIAGYYAMLALPQDMIGLSLTNTKSLVAPTYGKKAMLGTNPIALAAPSLHEPGFVLDMATSIVASGRITVHAKAGLDIPLGWGIDQAGNLTADPAQVKNGGALMPLGGPALLRGYKGYGLALLVDILSGVLSSGAFGDQVDQENDVKTSRISHFFAAIDIAAFRPVQEFKQDMAALLDEIRSSPKAENEERIYIHGEKEFESYQKSLKEGVPVMAEVVGSLQEEGAKFGVDFDLTALGENEVDEHSKEG